MQVMGLGRSKSQGQAAVKAAPELSPSAEVGAGRRRVRVLAPTFERSERRAAAARQLLTSGIPVVQAKIP